MWKTAFAVVSDDVPDTEQRADVVRRIRARGSEPLALVYASIVTAECISLVQLASAMTGVQRLKIIDMVYLDGWMPVFAAAIARAAVARHRRFEGDF